MSGPNSKPQQGAQDYRTPPAFLAAVLRRLGWDRFDWDLACEAHNCVGKCGGFFWPNFDALQQDWAPLKTQNLQCFLNPPFNQAGAFAKRCADSGARIAALVPVALGTKWWRVGVHEKADVLGVGRLRFNLPNGEPAAAAINRDCALLSYPGTGRYLLEDWSKW